MICASCTAPMDRIRGATGAFWMCRSCGARAATLAFLHRSLERAPLAKLWEDAKAGLGWAGRDCPSCRQSMREVSLLLSQDEDPEAELALVELDVCTSCRIVFFDHHEMEMMPMEAVGLVARGSRPPPPTQAPKSRAEVAMNASLSPELAYKLDRIERDDQRPGNERPAGWKMFAALFAPVEINPPALRHVPLATWGLAILLILVGLATFGHLNQVIADWGYIPSDPLRHGGLTLLSSFFLHGGGLHLFGNLWFLLTFGDNVEDILGRPRFLVTLVGATLTGIFFHSLADPSSTVPLVGASGGIAGVMVLYGLRFPQARLGMVIWFRWFTLPAWNYMMFWVGMQFLGTFASFGAPGGGVAYLAHLGGAVVGGAAWWFWIREA